MKKILFVTGTRADFGKLEPLAIAAQKEGYRVGFFVTGMHMLERYGLTKVEVERLADIDWGEYINQRNGDAQDTILAKTIVGFSDYIAEYRPDLVIIHGDRVEALAASLVCAINSVRSVHIEGGEVSGTIDEVYRHCNTKLCTAHLVSSETAKKRVVSLGESPDRVHVLGSPELDVHNAPSGVTLDEVCQRYDIPFDDYGIAIMHPVTSETVDIGSQAKAFFEALESSKRCFVTISPNNDPGCDAIFEAQEELPKDRFRVIASMRFAYFSELLRNARVVVGNSSVGVREALFLGIPSLNVGTRQNNRSIAPSIVNASAYDRQEIISFLTANWDRKFEKSSSFGDGSAVLQFVDILRTDGFWKTPLQKFFYENLDNTDAE